MFAGNVGGGLNIFCSGPKFPPRFYCVSKGFGNSAESLRKLQKTFCSDPFLSDPISEWLSVRTDFD